MMSKPVVVACLGSSTTAGKGQAFNWIAELERRSQNSRLRFINFGVGGDLAYNALRRLPSVLAARPDKVVILTGGNDVLASVFKCVGFFFRLVKHLPKPPSPGWFDENMQSIVRRLKAETSAAIALVSVPQVGEDPDPTDATQRELNSLYGRYNGMIKEVAAKEGVAYIPFYERLHEQIAACPGRAFTSFRFLSFYRDVFRYFILGRSTDEIAEMNGWRFHVDGVHLNSRGGKILADMVQEFLDA